MPLSPIEQFRGDFKYYINGRDVREGDKLRIMFPDQTTADFIVYSRTLSYIPRPYIKFDYKGLEIEVEIRKFTMGEFLNNEQE